MKNERIYPIPLAIKQYLQKLSSHERSLSNDIKLDYEILSIRRILATGASEANYKNFFHCTLWLEECEKLQEQNKPDEVQFSCTVEIYKIADNYSIIIPRDKQAYLKVGGSLKLSRINANDCITVNIEYIKDTFVIITGKGLKNYDLGNKKCEIKLTWESDIYEKMHAAVEYVHTNMKSYIFPRDSCGYIKSSSILQYFDRNVKHNAEQRTAVEHIVSGTSGSAPFLLRGPPGTGKTVTIVEAILQLVVSNFNNYILVCAHSNTAVDNVARVLQKYKKYFHKTSRKLFVRINSKSRNSVAEYLKEDCLYSPVKQDVLLGYRIILCTLNHSSSYNLNFVTHVVFDEAAQATEPSSLIPLSRLTCLRRVILAGDDKQLEAVVVSNEAKRSGLGISLMERLIQSCSIYKVNEGCKYMVMLKNNYRSHADIIDLPNRLFYGGHLRAMAAIDPLSETNILEREKKCRGVVFHNVQSTEVKDGTSYRNIEEFKIVQRYVIELLYRHGVKQEDIGIITPYKSQVHVIKEWIKKNNWRIDAESVDAFQGQEKRVILISTVRGKAEGTGATLGFVRDVKRFNVALTRAKAKVIVIGNSVSLLKSAVWKAYIQKCRKLGTSYVSEERILCKPSTIPQRLLILIYDVVVTIYSVIILLLVFVKLKAPPKEF